MQARRSVAEAEHVVVGLSCLKIPTTARGVRYSSRRREMGRAPHSNAAVAGAASPRAGVNLSALVRTTSCVAGDTRGCEKVSPQISLLGWQFILAEVISKLW